MNGLGIGINVYRAGYICTNNIFKDKDFIDERIVGNYELVIFLTDGGYFKVNGEKYIITAGSGRLYRPGDKVQSYKFNDVYSVHFGIDNNKNKDLLESIPSFFRLSDVSETVKIINNLSSALLKNNDLDCVCRLCELLTHVKSNVIRKNQKENIIKSVKKYIDINFAENVTLDLLSTLFYLHPIYLQRKFKQEYGLSPTDYLTKVRIDHAKYYLVSTDMSIEEICYKVGFSYPSYFIKTFKKKANHTPNQYRKLLLPTN